MRYKEIAVIGMSGRFAGAPDLKSFRDILLNKKSMISTPSEQRLSLMKQPSDGIYMQCGYLDNIDKFDNTFFDIGKRESRLMSPEQRICLEMAAEAIMDAGYSLSGFRGANCGVYVADSASEYERSVEKRSSASIIGSKSFMLSGQIGYHFDLRGENLSINSGCSSSLLAVHYACEKITFGEVETALVGGIILEPEVPRAKDNQYDILGIMSDDYTIRSFDEKANGTVSGEGGGFILLKSLEQAEKDGDHIYGVILSGAVNGDGGRCTSVSMPSVEAQGDVICKAWADAPISELTEIEAHGIGAPVGDAVEAQGMIDAVLRYDLKDNAVKVSTVKSNIGHLFPLSGITSLIKTLIGYQYCESYPIAVLETLNPLIHFSDAGLLPLREVYHWEPDARRMTGISSFGLNGCNTHIVLRNNITEQKQTPPQALLKLSAHTPVAFADMKRNVLHAIRKTDSIPSDLIYTLNTGRDDYEYRKVIYAESFTDMLNALESAVPEKTEGKDYQVIFAVKTEDSDNPSLAPFTSIMPALRDQVITGNPDTDRKLMLYNCLTDAGIRSKTLLIDKIFSTAVKVQSGECDHDAFRKVLAETEINHDYSAYQKQISAKSKDKPTIVVDFSKEKSIRSDDNESVRVFHVQEPDELAAMLTFWYENGSELDWNAFCKADGLHRTPAPIYPFERKSFWIEPKQPASNTSAAVKTVRSEAPASPAVTLPQKKIFLICSENVSDISLSDYPYSDPDFRSVFAPETAEIGTDSRLAMLKYISQAGVQPDILLADQNGKAIYSFSKGRISSKRLIEAADLPDYTNIDKIISNIESAAKTNAVTVFDFCRSDALSKHSWNGAVRIVPVFSEGAFSDYLKNPEQTIQVAVPAVSETAEPIQTEQSAAPSSAAAAAVTEKTQELIDAELFLEKTWAKAFNLDGEIGHDEDFFALGGNSLIMQSMSDEINDHFNKKFDIFEIYDYETIEKLAAKILEED